MTGAAGMCFYMFMTYATYIGNTGYGILVAVTGVIIMASRIFDGITDPLCAFIIERFNPKHGKIRIFMFLGWAVMALATTAMSTWGAGHLKGAAGLVFFIVTYMIYIIGYTLVGVSTSMTGNIMTNDPKQRPTFSVWSTVYSYLTPMIIMLVSTLWLLPKFNNKISTGFLAADNLLCLSLALVFYILAAIGMKDYDIAENYESLSADKDKDEKPGLKEMWDLLKNNKELQRYTVAAASDKLAQTVGSASVIGTLLGGVMIGNMQIMSVISTVTMLPSIVFAIVGAVIAGRIGNKKCMVDFTWVCIVLNVIYGVFLLFSDTTKISVAFLPTAIFIVVNFLNNAAKMIVSTSTNALRMDIVDYELDRSGRFMPASISATYSFIDKLISSVGNAIPTAMIGLIGYTKTVPQPGDPLTMGVKIMVVVLLIGFPIGGWICTVVAMRHSELSKERVAQIAKDIADKKSALMEEEEADTVAAAEEDIAEV